MARNAISDYILAILDGFTLDNADDIALGVAENFRKRRVEKNITRQRIAELSGVPLSTVARFEQKGLIAFGSLIRLAMALGYTTEVKELFGTAKFDTIAELDLIRRKTGDKRAYHKAINMNHIASDQKVSTPLHNAENMSKGAIRMAELRRYCTSCF